MTKAIKTPKPTGFLSEANDDRTNERSEASDWDSPEGKSNLRTTRENGKRRIEYILFVIIARSLHRIRNIENNREERAD